MNRRRLFLAVSWDLLTALQGGAGLIHPRAMPADTAEHKDGSMSC